MPHDEHVMDLLPTYVLGSLDAGEAARVEEHLLSCLICRNETDAFQSVAGQLGFAAPQAAPSPDLEARLLQRVHAAHASVHLPPQSVRRSVTERLLPVWGLASLGLIIVLAVMNLALWQRLDRLEFLTAPGGMRAIPLTASEADSGATGFVVISADGRNGALVVEGLPPLGEDRQYQLWLIRNGQSTSAAVFSTDEQSYGGTRIRAPGSLLEYSAVSITIEPAGGSRRPAGRVVLGGLLSMP